VIELEAKVRAAVHHLLLFDPPQPVVRDEVRIARRGLLCYDR